MSATFAMKDYKFNHYGSYTLVPDHAIARLMYYLHCVLSLLDYSDDTIANFQNYDELNVDQLAKVLLYAKVFYPQRFINAEAVVLDRDLLNDSPKNDFIEMIGETKIIHINEEFGFVGREVRVRKKMKCNQSWLTVYYYRPMEIINNIIDEYEKEKSPRIITIPDFKSSPIAMICPFCQVAITTKTEPKLNCVACCCFLFFGLLYCCFQLCSNRNVCCCDIAHKCPRCGRVLGYYKSC